MRYNKGSFVRKLKYLFVTLFLMYCIGHYYIVNLGETVYENVNVYKIDTVFGIFAKVRIVKTSVGDFEYIPRENKTWSDLLNETEMQEGVNCKILVRGLRSELFKTKPYIVKIRCKSSEHLK